MALLSHALRTASVVALLGSVGCNLDTGDPSEPKTIYGASSTAQSVKTNAPTTLSVFVLNNFGEPITGANVTFALASGTGTLSATSASTASSGLAQVTYTPTKAGTSIINVTAGGLKPLPFTIIASD